MARLPGFPTNPKASVWHHWLQGKEGRVPLCHLGRKTLLYILISIFNLGEVTRSRTGLIVLFCELHLFRIPLISEKGEFPNKTKFFLKIPA